MEFKTKTTKIFAILTFCLSMFIVAASALADAGVWIENRLDRKGDRINDRLDMWSDKAKLRMFPFPNCFTSKIFLS